MTSTKQASSSERGAVLVHVAIALLVMMGFSAFVIDYGVLWTARNQAQNAADAAALAGAVSMAYDKLDLSPTGPPALSANAILMRHPIWGQAPVVGTNDISFPTCPDDSSPFCIQVEVHRDVARGNPLPMFFGQLVGLNQQGVRAVAIAKVMGANGADCLKPWGVADKWFEANNPTAQFDSWIYDPTGMPGDSYTAPTSSSPGTGFDSTRDHGMQLRLKVGQPGDQINGGWFRALNLISTTGTGGYRSQIRECLQNAGAIGDTKALNPDTLANLLVGTAGGVSDLINLDPGATWDPTALGGHGSVTNSCVQTNTCTFGNTGHPSPYRMSPRVVAVPVFDLDYYTATGSVRIVNILGYFIEGMSGNDVLGYLVTAPGVFKNGAGAVYGPSSFIKLVGLIR